MAEAMHSGNPTLRPSIFEGLEAGIGGQKMTIAGTVNKTITLLVLCLVTGYLSWQGILTGGTGSAWAAAPMVGAIGGFIVAMITCFKREWAPTTAPIYALLEGLFLGGFSAIMNKMYPGIVVQAVALTFLVFFCMLMAYKSGLIKVTQNFVLGVVACTGAICLFYVGSLLFSLFGVTGPVNLIWSNGWLGIGLSVFICIIAALNLVLDFAFIESGEEAGAPKYMEWYGAFGLMVTLVWLYIEILRLLSKLRR